MKLIANRADLMRAIPAAAGVVERRTTIPVLACLLLRAGAEGLTVVATDLDRQFEAQCPAQVDAPGFAAIDARRLASIVQAAPEGCQIGIAVGDGRAVVTHGRSRFSLPVLPGDDFPDLAKAFTPVVTFEADAAAMGAALALVRPAICPNEARYYLHGVRVHVQDAMPMGGPGGLRFTATDGHRVLFARMDAVADGLPEAIVPPKSVDLLMKLPPCDGVWRVEASAAMWRVTGGGATLITKLVDGSFPDADRVVPTGNANTAIVRAAALVAAVRRVALVSAYKTSAVALDFDADAVRVRCSSPEYGEAVEEVACLYTGAPMTIGANAAYLMQMAQSLAGEDDLSIEMGDRGEPMLMRVPEALEALGVLMPMRT